MAFILSYFDFCNTLFACFLACTLASVEHLACWPFDLHLVSYVLNTATLFVDGLPARVHINDTSCCPSPVVFVTNSDFVCMMCTLIHSTSQTQLLEFQLFLAVVGSNLSTSVSLTYLEPGLNSVRAFSMVGTREWNAKPAAVRNITEVSAFRSSIKTHFFKITF